MSHDTSTSDGNVADDIDVFVESILGKCVRDLAKCVHDKWLNVHT